MQKHIERRVLPYTQQQMFDLVADVGSYEKFAPWCMKSKILKSIDKNTFDAELVVGYKMFRERFISRVILKNPEHIYIEYQKGPLKHLHNNWHFSSNENNHCIIDFNVEFEFKNSILQGMAQVFFQEILKRMIDAFEDRAKEIYTPLS